MFLATKYSSFGCPCSLCYMEVGIFLKLFPHCLGKDLTIGFDKLKHKRKKRVTNESIDVHL